MRNKTKNEMTDYERKLHEEFVADGRAIKERMKRCKVRLLEIDRRKVWKKVGFESIYEYAAKLAGMSKWQVDDALRILRKVEKMPRLQEDAEEKGLARVRPVIAVATVETDGFWADKAEEMGRSALETYVCEKRKLNVMEDKEYEDDVFMSEETGKVNREEIGPRTNLQPDECVEVLMRLRLEIAEKLEEIRGGRSFDELMEELVKLKAGVLKKPKPVRTESRYIPVAIRRYAVWRDRGLCAFPGCNKEYKILHHTQRWALDRVHDPDKIYCLCEGHERLMHMGLVAGEEGPPDGWRVLDKQEVCDSGDCGCGKQYIDELVGLYRG